MCLSVGDENKELLVGNEQSFLKIFSLDPSIQHVTFEYDKNAARTSSMSYVYLL